MYKVQELSLTWNWSEMKAHTKKNKIYDKFTFSDAAGINDIQTTDQDEKIPKRWCRSGTVKE